MKRFALFALLFFLLAQACNLGSPAVPSATAELPPTQVPPTSVPTAVIPTATPVPLDLDHLPLHWFAPLPWQLPPAYDGSDDYMELFDPEADWDEAAAGLQVFKLYGGWVATESSAAQRRQVIAEIRRRGLGLAVEFGPLVPDETCGHYIEGFAGDQSLVILTRIKEAGGTLDFITFDEPYYYAHFYDGEQACQWTTEDIAAKVDLFVQQVRPIFPDVAIGDIEPLTGPADAAAYRDWLLTYKRVNGYDLAFLHLDIDWSNSTWPAEMIEMEGYAQELGIPLGIIYTGNPQDQTDEAWLSIAGERVKLYELEAGGRPDHVIFQSWHDHPDRALPESNPYTYTGFIRTYFEDKTAIGFSPDAMAGNLALHRPVRVSRFLTGYGGELAVDGDPGTIWSSGDDAPGWIQVDLGQPRDIAEIHLLISQYPAGRTVHRLLGSGPGTGGQMVVLHTFDGPTDDSDSLDFIPAESLVGIQTLRIETVTSVSWVAWREITVVGE